MKRGAILVALVGITQLVTSTVHLIVRDRRRAELMTLLFVVFLPLLGMLPGITTSVKRRSSGAPERIMSSASSPLRASSVR